MKKVCLFLIVLMIILSGCSPNSNGFPNIVPPAKTSNNNTSNNGGFWQSNQPTEEPQGGYWKFVRSECNDFVQTTTLIKELIGMEILFQIV